MAGQGAPKSHLLRNLALVLMLVGGLGYALSGFFHTSDEARRAAHVFMRHIRTGHVADAYADLSSARRAAMTEAAWAELASDRILRRHRHLQLRKLEEAGDAYCISGLIDVDHDDDYAIELYVVLDEDDAYHVQSFAVQPPGTHAAVVLEECGHTPGASDEPTIVVSTPLLP